MVGLSIGISIQEILLIKFRVETPLSKCCLAAIWKVIKTLLTAEQQKRVIFVNKNSVQQYIDKEQLLVHMGGTVSAVINSSCLDSVEETDSDILHALILFTSL